MAGSEADPSFVDWLRGQTVSEAVNLTRLEGADSGIAHITEVATNTNLSQYDQMKFENESLLGVADQTAWDLGLSDDGHVGPFLELLPTDWSWPGRVADLGVQLAREESRQSRAAFVLGHAAGMFESWYFEDAPSLHPEIAVERLTEHYLPVSDYQELAQDQTGAQDTAHKVGLHLFTLTEAVNIIAEQEDSPKPRHDHDAAMSAAIVRIGTLDTALTQALFASIRVADTRALTTHNIARRQAGAMINGGDIAAGLLRLEGYHLPPLDETWLAATRLIQQGEFDQVSGLISGIEDRFPDYFSNPSDDALLMTPVLDVLRASGRDDVLGTMFAGLINNSRNTSPIIDFAQECGRQGDSQRLRDVLAQADLSQYDLAHRVFEAYADGTDERSGQ